MLVELTPKEIERLGQYRYLTEKGRGSLALAILGVSLAAIFLIAMYAPPLPTLLAQVIYIAWAIIGGGYFFKVVQWDAPHAGKQLREQYDKENRL